MSESELVVIRECDPEVAEAVLVVRVTLPDGGACDETRHPLARSRPRLHTAEVTSVTVLPSGAIVERGTLPLTDRPLVTLCSHADGRTADGRGIGYGKMVSVEGRDAGAVRVWVSLHWAARDGGRGDAAGELVVPWLGAADAALGGGVRVSGRITPVG